MRRTRWTQASKDVGWDPFVADYPSLEQVGHARETDDGYSLLRWNRFLPSPANEEEATIVEAVVTALAEVRARLEQEYVDEQPVV